MKAIFFALFILAGSALADEVVTVPLPASQPAPAKKVVFVELRDAPAARVFAGTARTGRGRPDSIQAAAISAARAQIDRIDKAHQEVRRSLRNLGAAEMYSVKRVLNGFAVAAGEDKIEQIKKIKGVARVREMTMLYPTNARMVQFIGAPAVWQNALGLSAGAKGDNITVGVIDTGIDYQHANFGGTGLQADYDANNRTVITENGTAAFPTSKVVGGWDFAGDGYTGGNAPSPDPDPMDCNSHGTHVAGTIAGLGVTSAGAPYAGPYTGDAPFDSLRIGPGVAPGAVLYALRVFGCDGGTYLAVNAIEWAMDPNGDGNLSDHLDVINLSLGSSFGYLSDIDAQAVDAASQAGVLVAAAAGNDGNTYFITGGPGVGDYAVTASAITDSRSGSPDNPAYFTSRGPRSGAPVHLKPDIAMPGVSIVSSLSGIDAAGGTTQTGSRSATYSGTSMATPATAGALALLRELHPNWRVEEIKALLMNYAVHDVYETPGNGGGPASPIRVGAGRADLSRAAAGTVIAYNADEPGVVSASFDVTDVAAPGTLSKTIAVENKGAAPQTYDVSINTVVDTSGAAFALPSGSTVTVEQGRRATLELRLATDPDAMQHTRDATVPNVQAAPSPFNGLGSVSRHWLTEEAGYINFSQGGTVKFRLPFYAVVRPAGSMTGAMLDTLGAGIGTGSIALTGTAVCTGSLGAGPVCSGTYPTDRRSTVTPFELQAVSSRNGFAPGYADIRYVGVAYDPATQRLMFGIVTWNEWSSPSDVALSVDIDGNADGDYERTLFNSDPGSMAILAGQGYAAQDSFLSAVINWSTLGLTTAQSWAVNRLSPASLDTSVFQSNVMMIWAPLSNLNVTAGASFRYRILTCPGWYPTCNLGEAWDLVAGPITWNTSAQGLNFNGASAVDSLNGAGIPVAWNAANMTTNGSKAALLLHHSNQRGAKAQVVPLDTTLTADLGITMSVDDPSPNSGENAVFTLEVTNNSSNPVTGVEVSDLLPLGLEYVTDSTGGVSYDAGTGIWSAGALGGGESKTLTITARAVSSAPVVNRATITNSSELDELASNDSAEVTVQSARWANLSARVTAGTALANRPFTYTVTLENSGADTAYDLHVTNSIAGSLTVSSGAASDGAFNSSTGNWDISSLGNGMTATLEMTVNAPGTIGAVLSNTAAVSGATAELDYTDNTGSASVTVSEEPTPTPTATPTTPVAAPIEDPLVVVKPNGREKLRAGKPYTVKWNASPPAGTKVKIELWFKSKRKAVISKSANNSGSFKWKVSPKLSPKDGYKIVVRSAADANMVDSSDASFKITAPKN